MWVFGYGSLMSDGWQKNFGCLEVVRADLFGYVRVFNKKSTENWGSRAAPGPTLNVVASEGGVCTGMAFRFDDAQADEVLAALRVREGKNFDLVPLDIDCQGKTVEAFVPLYRGKNLFATKDPAELASLALQAEGKTGRRCRDYVDNIHQQLQLLGIDDPAVSAIWKSLQKLIAKQPGQ